MIVKRNALTLTCPSCLERDATLDLRLGSHTCHCHDCDSDFHLDIVRHIVEDWQPILAWLDAMPTSDTHGVRKDTSCTIAN